MAKAPIAQCALCDEKKLLRDSHLIPKAAYRHIRDEPDDHGGAPLKVHIAEKEAYHTDHQVKKYLLCGDCELLFSQYGESVVSRYWGTQQGFPLLEYLEANARLEKGKAITAYDPGLIRPDLIEALYYFGASVVWRSSRWDWGRKKSPHLNSLGRHYDQVFRDYLLRRTGRMENVRLFLNVNTNPELNGMLGFPYYGRDHLSHYHRFNMLGMHFNYMVGKVCRLEIERVFKYFNAGVVVASSDFSKSREIVDLAREFQQIQPKGIKSDSLRS